MSYYELYSRYKALPLGELFHRPLAYDVEAAIDKDSQDAKSLLALLSVRAEDYIERMAQRSHGLTMMHFGRDVQLYTPLYLSDYCDNECVYCGFNSQNVMPRRKLRLDEVEKEARYISRTGLEHVLALTGDSRENSPFEYIKDCIRILRKYFSSISIEIYALTEREYAQMIEEGVDGLTIYQETYDQEIYSDVHKSGPKKDYLFRLNAPERAARVKMRNINIGVLLGLNDWRQEAFFMGLHAKYLQDTFYDTEIAVSIPRLRPHKGYFKIPFETSKRNIAQLITAMRIFLPRVGITMSTREAPQFREDLLPLGITRMSAGSVVEVGGHTREPSQDKSPAQFEIADKRGVNEIKAMLNQKGYQPVLKDWMRI